LGYEREIKDLRTGGALALQVLAFDLAFPEPAEGPPNDAAL
jgi:hypothetical protein